MPEDLLFGVVAWGAALYLYRAKIGNRYFVWALLAFGLPSVVSFLASTGMLPYELYDLLAFSRYGTVAALILGVIGLIALGQGAARSANGRLQGAHAADVSTLFTPRNDTNTFSRGETLRDEACMRLVTRAKDANLAAVEQRSQAHSPEVWFRIDYTLPTPRSELALTASVAVGIERHDFHRFEHTFTVTVKVGTKTATIDGVFVLDDAAVERIHRHIIKPGGKLRLQNRIRVWPWQLWRPRNKIQRFRPDPVAVVGGVVGVAALAIPYIGFLITIFIFLALYLRGKGRRTYVLTTGKPFSDPRSLRWMDSWQASIFGLGERAVMVRDGILARLRESGPVGATVKTEQIGYWGTDSWVQREQVVVTHRRAMGFIHVATYGDVLYVGWECHLNNASWVEQTLGSGLDRQSALDVVANRVVAGYHKLNEYDVSDSNFLAEWIHEAMKREITLRMAEHKIDQEIDFTVQRESRTEVLATRDPERTESPLAKRLKRLA